MKGLNRRSLTEYFWVTLGAVLVAAGVYFFKFPNNFSTGGVSGISIVLAHYAPNLSAGAFVFIINMLLRGLVVTAWRLRDSKRRDRVT